MKHSLIKCLAAGLSYYPGKGFHSYKNSFSTVVTIFEDFCIFRVTSQPSKPLIMAKKESVLTDVEKESFEIEKFIFHIILESELKPIYLDEIVLVDKDQIEFFKQRFKDVSEGVQHVFVEKNKSNFYKDCNQLLKDPGKHFLTISEKLTASFKEFHNKNMNDGVFITSIVKVNKTRRLIFLLKIDHKKVYEYHIKGKKALLTEITKTFVEDKKAIQKSALVDISDHYSWDVLATDRSATGKLALRDYFAKFLNVVEKDTPSSLTPKVISAVRKWAIANKETGKLQHEVSNYKNKVIDYLKGAAKYKTKDCINAVLDEEDDDEKGELSKSLKSFFDDSGLTGQSFAPNLNRIDTAARKHIRRTAEGVVIQWEGDPAELNIEIPIVPNNNDGLYHILIKTSNLEVIDKDV